MGPQVSLWPCNACYGPCAKILAGKTSLQALSNICGTFSSSLSSGEWGVHLSTFGPVPEATLRSHIMLLPLCVSAPSLTLQERVDAWASSIGRPILYGCADTIHLSLEDICIRVQGIRDASWPLIRPLPQLADSLWLPGLSNDGTFIQYQYEIRTLVYQNSSEAFGLSYTAEHWSSQKLSRSALSPAIAVCGTALLCHIALRSTGQEKSSEGYVTTCS